MTDVSGAPATKPVIKYRSKKVMSAVAKEAVKDRVKSDTPKVEPNPIVKKRGRPPVVVKDFNDDHRSISMAIYIEQGLSTEESGLLAGFMPEELTSLQEKSDTYRRFIELSFIKFKQKHLKVIDKAENPSTSQWMLENKFPETYGKKAKGGNEVGSTQVIQAIIRSVQMNNDNLVPHDSENAEEKESGLNIEQLPEGHKSPFDVGGANIL